MKSWFSKKDRLLAGTIIASASVLGFAAPAMAQDDVAEEEEAIVVTGSRIARANLTSPTAVTTVDAQSIELSGEDNIAEILRSIPSFGVSGISSGNSNFFTTSNGINTLQLRNLGEDRTLVLVNGRRYVSGVPSSAAVDFNSIPTDLLERVEVVTGGASAIYGADALAGVINLILRDDFEGIEYRYQYGESDYGDDVNHRFSVLVGGNFADGRGNAVLNAAFTQNLGVYARDRPNTQFDDLAQCYISGSDCTIQNAGLARNSSFGPYGRFYDYDIGGGSYAVSTGTGFTAGIAPFSSALYGFNRQSQRRYTVPLERFMLSGLASYEINASTEAFVETTYAHMNASSDLEPFPHSNSDIAAGFGGVPCTNPYVPAALFALTCDNGQTAIPYTRRMVEVGNRGNQTNRNTFRVLLGLRGDFADRFNWETFYSYGRTEDSLQGGGQINVNNLRAGLNVIDQDGDPLTTDDIICADPVAFDQGCVPVNLFGLGAVTPEAAAWIYAPVQRQAFTQQEYAGANISGPLFAMPAGDAEFAFGVEWRREGSEDITDALTQTGQNAGNVQEPSRGGYSVGELFFETEFPLLRDAPLAHELSVGAAFRWSDYDVAGETEAYSGRIQWAPTEWLRFRAQYARAVRVPNIGELFGPGGENFAAVADPCNGVSTTSVGDIDDNCRADPVVLARIIADGGTMALTQPEIQGTGGFTGAGDPNLQPETADSYTAGFIINYDFGAPGSMIFSVDWYQIEIESIIRAYGRQETLGLCYDVDPADFATNAICDNVVRQDIFVNPALNGAILEVNTNIFNDVGVQEFSGVDVSWVWNFALSDWFGAVPGDFQARLNWTHLLYESEDGPGDTVGSLGSPENKWQAGLLYNVGAWNFSWETNYIESTAPLPDDFFFGFQVGDYTTHDIRIGWDVSESANLYFGSNNVFDEDAPAIYTGVPGNTTGTATNAAIFDPIGRTYYAGIRLRY